MIKKLIIIFGLALMGCFVGATIFLLQNINKKTEAPTLVYNPVKFANYKQPDSTNPNNGQPINFVHAAEISTPSVVHIQTMVRQQNYFNSPIPDYYRDFFGFNMPQPTPKVGSGSGVIISPDGYIVSNNHVIEDAEEIQVILNDKRTYSGKIIGKDPNTDLALIKIDEKNLPYIKFADSEKSKIGEWVLAVGNPFNLTSTVTAGIISAKGRSINIFNRGKYPYAVESFIQTDAAINPGNSGGALVDLNGNLLGINTAIASQTGSYAGYGFAIPSNLVRKIVDDFMKYGVVQRAFIGISMQTVDAGLAKTEGLNNVKGVYVADVMENGAAQDAGIKKGDILLSINGVDVNTASDLQEQIVQYRPGQKIKIIGQRNGKSVEFDVTLKNLLGNTNLLKKEKEEHFAFLDAEFSTLTADEKSKMGINSGVKITKLGNSPLKSIGIEPGYVITAVDNKPINKMDDLKQALRGKRGGVLIEGYYSRGRKVFYGFEL